MSRLFIPDPGVGDARAEIGTRKWAERVRLKMQGLVRSMPNNPRFLQDYIRVVMEHQAWMLMSKPDGSVFATWEEFCAYRYPWGLGKPWCEIRLYLDALHGGSSKEDLRTALVLLLEASERVALRQPAASDRGRPVGVYETFYDAIAKAKKVIERTNKDEK